MQVVEQLNAIDGRQYWKVEQGDEGETLACVPKPAWICTVSQSLEFARVVSIVKDALDEEPLQDPATVRSGIALLRGRYTRLMDKRSWVGTCITALFLWLAGFNGQNSLEAMMTSLEGRIADPEYSLEAMIEKIHQQMDEGKKVCLFIGRSAEEPLPSDKGEAKEDEIWISADVVQIKKPLGERIYLLMDFNEQADVKKIAGLFTKVVIDQSTIKHLKRDFARRFSILLKDENSEMVFEAFNGLSFISPEEADRSFDPVTGALTLSVARAVTMRENFAWCYQQFKQHLDTLYNEVELHLGRPFPYWSNYRTANNPFFIVRKPNQM